MANYVGRARSNYFRVKDLPAFTAVCEPLDISVQPHTDDPSLIMMMVESDNGGWPSNVYDEDQDNYVDVDMCVILSEHLLPGEVAVLIEVGYEKMRYLFGQATAVNSAGETRVVALDSIYDLAAQLGDNVTDASY